MESEEEGIGVTSSLHKQNSNSTSSSKWNVLGRSFPRSEVVFFSQMIIIIIVVLASIYNLSTSEKNHSLWSALLSGSLGGIFPNPTIKSKSRK